MNIRNQVRLIGNVGAAPEVKALANDNAIARFSIATNEVSKNKKGEKIVETQWHNIVAWGKAAERVQKLVQKGTELAIEGKLVTRTYEDAAGTKRYVTEIVLNDLLLLSKKPTA
jgi:single-strand DNA-binding protein